MKKIYIKPECVVEELSPETMLAASRVEIGSNETPGTQDDFNANKRRGKWGNLWDDKGE